MNQTFRRLVILLLLASCTPQAEVPASDRAAPAEDASAGKQTKNQPAPAITEPPDLETAPSTDAPQERRDSESTCLQRLQTAPILGARPVSLRSFSLKVVLDGEHRAVFKPLRKGNRTAVYEVAYTLLGKHLHGGRIPVSTMRTLRIPGLIGHLNKVDPKMALDFEQAVTVTGKASVRGAMIEWIDGITRSDLDAPGGRKILGALVSRTGPDTPRAAQASAMLVSDYVLGNWDRFSGGNLFAEEKTGDLVLIDNNGSFGEWSQKQASRMNDLLALVERFSSRQMEALRNLTPARIAKLVEMDGGGDPPLLTKSEIDLVMERKTAVLARVDLLTATHDPSFVICFE